MRTGATPNDPSRCSITRATPSTLALVLPLLLRWLRHDLVFKPALAAAPTEPLLLLVLAECQGRDVPALDRLVRGPEEVDHRDARDLGWVLEGQEQPSLGALVGPEGEDALLVECDIALGDLVAGSPQEHVGERR